MIVVLFAAFPQELKQIRKMIRSVSRERRLRCDVIPVQTGVGVQSAEVAFDCVFRNSRPDLVLSVGFGGALYEGAGIGDIVWSSKARLLDDVPGCEMDFKNVIPDSEIGRRLGQKLNEVVSAREGNIVTLAAMMPKAKIRKMIPGGLMHPVCDMETFYLARLSHQHRVPFLALRAISDDLDEDIPPELFGVTDENGLYRVARALGLLLAKPALIPASVKLGINAARASKSLGDAVGALVKVLSKQVG